MLEFQVNPDPQVETVPRVTPENQAALDHRALAVKTASLEREVSQDLLGLEARRECQETPDSQVKRGQGARTERRDQLVQ